MEGGRGKKKEREKRKEHKITGNREGVSSSYGKIQQRHKWGMYAYVRAGTQHEVSGMHLMYFLLAYIALGFLLSCGHMGCNIVLLV